MEGAEPLVAGALDLDHLFIEVLIVENRNNFCPKHACPSRRQMRELMSRHGYQLFPNLVAKSDLYVHPRSAFLVKALRAAHGE